MVKQTAEAAFETAIEAALLADGYVSLPSTVFDRERVAFPESALEVMKADTRRMRGERPYVMTNLKDGTGLEQVIAFVEHQGMLECADSE